MEVANTRPIEDDAQIVRSLIEYYLSARADNIKSLITLQGFLFAALGFSWDKGMRLSLLLAVVGLISSIAFYGYIDVSENAIRELRAWWKARLAENHVYTGPPVLDLPTSVKDRFTGLRDPINVLIFMLGSAWGGILYIVVMR